MKVNVSGISMSVETGDITIIIDSFLETLRKELIKIAGDDATTLKESINLLKQRELIIKSKPLSWTMH